MKKPVLSRRLLWLIWIATVVAFFGVALYPISSRWTRMGGTGLLGLWWFGLIALVWRKVWARWMLLTVTIFLGCFLLLPGARVPSATSLRAGYILGLGRYQGVTYYWGGESPKGIDCSGLVRRGLIDSLFLRGIRTLAPGLVRRSLSLWWHDTSARALGQQHAGLTVLLFDTPSVNQLDHARILP